MANDQTTIEQLREQVERAKLSRELRDLTESGPLSGLDQFVDPAVWRTDPYTGSPLGASYLSSFGDRSDGRDEPFYRSPFDVDSARAIGRMLVNTTIGANVVENLSNYVIGEGFKPQAMPKMEGGDAELAEAAQEILDEFLELNSWSGDLEVELFQRSLVDGEFFLCLNPTDDEMVEARTIEPEQVVEPHDQRGLESQLGIDIPSSWSFGVHTPEGDIQKVLGYYVQHSESPADFDYYPIKPWDYPEWQCSESVIEHYRRNVFRSVKRGRSDFYPVGEDVEGTRRLSRNLREGATAQASIAYIRKHASTAEDTVRRLVTDNATSRFNIQKASGGSREVSHQRMLPATRLDISAGMDFMYGPLGTPAGPALVEVLQAAIRWVAIRWCMPEFMLSSDASNANYSSTFVSENPFVKACRANQRRIGVAFTNVFWKVLAFAHKAGRLGSGEDFAEVRKALKIKLVYPNVEARNRVEETTRYEKLNKAGVLSKRTWTELEEFDYEVQQEQISEEPQPQMLGPDGMPLPGQEQGQQPGQWQQRQPLGQAGLNLFESADLLENCGTGKGGWQQGNTCAKGGGGGRKQTASPAFRKWFGQSKVVDENGEPLVMFRGSRNKDASSYGDSSLIFLSGRRETAENYGTPRPFYVKADRPFDASRGEGYELYKQFRKETSQPSYTTQGSDRGALPFWTVEGPLRSWLDSKGIDYDAIYFAENDGSSSIAVLGSDQILSASDLTESADLLENCGTGKGGWQPGNTCAKGGGGSAESEGGRPFDKKVFWLNREVPKEVVETVREELDRLARVGVGVQGAIEKLKQVELITFGEMYKRYGDDAQGAMGVYEARNIAVVFERPPVDVWYGTKVGDITPGAQLAADPSYRTVLAHEVGHALSAELAWKEPELRNDWLRALVEAYPTKSATGAGLSNYASTHVEEAFAEAFCVYTHPKYRKGKLPESIERYFDYATKQNLGGAAPTVPMKAAAAKLLVLRELAPAPDEAWTEEDDSDRDGSELARESRLFKERNGVESVESLDLLENCGTGAGGFQPGNKCQPKGDGVSEPAGGQSKHYSDPLEKWKQHKKDGDKWRFLDDARLSKSQQIQIMALMSRGELDIRGEMSDSDIMELLSDIKQFEGGKADAELKKAQENNLAEGKKIAKQLTSDQKTKLLEARGAINKKLGVSIEEGGPNKAQIDAAFLRYVFDDKFGQPQLTALGLSPEESKAIYDASKKLTADQFLRPGFDTKNEIHDFESAEYVIKGFSDEEDVVFNDALASLRNEVTKAGREDAGDEIHPVLLQKLRTQLALSLKQRSSNSRDQVPILASDYWQAIDRVSESTRGSNPDLFANTEMSPDIGIDAEGLFKNARIDVGDEMHAMMIDQQRTVHDNLSVDDWDSDSEWGDLDSKQESLWQDYESRIREWQNSGNEELAVNAQSMIESVPPRVALDKYISTSVEELTLAMRDAKGDVTAIRDPLIASYIDTIDAVANNILFDDGREAHFPIYRGINVEGDSELLGLLSPGTTFPMWQPTSWSLDPEIAKRFSSGNGERLIFRLHRAKKGAYVARLSAIEDEEEIIKHSSQSYRVISRQPGTIGRDGVSRATIVDLEEVEDE